MQQTETDEQKLARLTARFEHVSTLKGRYYGIEATRLRREITVIWKRMEAEKKVAAA